MYKTFHCEYKKGDTYKEYDLPYVDLFLTCLFETEDIEKSCSGLGIMYLQTNIY